MRFQFGLDNFRGFRDQPLVNVAPLTLLVGENSAGKTSFMAALKYFHDLFNTSIVPNFNGDPFQLGTFDQIAHMRGGRGGQAKEFRLRATKSMRNSRNQQSKAYRLDCCVSFASIDSLAAITKVDFKVDAVSLSLSVAPETAIVTYSVGDGEERVLPDMAALSFTAANEIHRYLPYIVNQWQYVFDSERSIVKGNGDLTEIQTAAEKIASFVRIFADRLNATSAIRTKPQRTYTPGIEAEDGEGSHVPFEMAKLARQKNKPAWESLRSRIAKFGQDSEMFQDVHVKLLGTAVSDPFQIQFSSNGPKMNMADLGYGTSQVLPLLYELGRQSKPAEFLIQQPEVHLHPRAQAALGEAFVEAQLESGHNFVLETHSDFIVDRVRNAVAEGRIPPSNVSILFFERHRLENNITQIRLGKNGDPIDPPQTYRDFFVAEQLKMLGA